MTYAYTNWNDTTRDTYQPRYTLDLFRDDNTNETNLVQTQHFEVLRAAYLALSAIPGADVICWEWFENGDLCRNISPAELREEA